MPSQTNENGIHPFVIKVALDEYGFKGAELEAPFIQNQRVEQDEFSPHPALGRVDDGPTLWDNIQAEEAKAGRQYHGGSQGVASEIQG